MRNYLSQVNSPFLPFGPIADENKKISWPPEHETLMSMVGFEEAYEHSITVRLSSEPVLDIKLPTLPGLAIMKLISWKDNLNVAMKREVGMLPILYNCGSLVGFMGNSRCHLG